VIHSLVPGRRIDAHLDDLETGQDI